MQDEYARRLSDWIKVDPNIIHVELDKARRTGAAPTATGVAVLKRSSGQVRLEKEVLKIAIQFQPMAKPYVEDIVADDFTVPAHRAIWSALAAGSDPSVAADALDDAPARRAYTELAVQPAAGEINDRLVADLFRRLKEFALSRQIDEAKARLQRLNPENEGEEYHRLFTELVGLEARKRRLTEGEEEDR